MEERKEGRMSERKEGRKEEREKLDPMRMMQVFIHHLPCLLPLV
jgi:hypothetical protein